MLLMVKKYLVLEDETIDTTPVVNNNNIEIVFKRGVTLSRGTTTNGLQKLMETTVGLVNARFSGFSTAGDKAIIVNGERAYLTLQDFKL
jgi:hypothetical protein